MFKRIGVKAVVSSDIEEIRRAEKLLLPGVGAFDAAMQRINNIPGLRTALDQLVLKDGVPLLGICLGMQLLTDGSDEGKLAGLGYISGRTMRFPKDANLKVPHMGWNLVNVVRQSPIATDFPPEPRFYFVHSYYVRCDDERHVVGTTHYGFDFHSLIQKGQVFGAQFHPEKSHKFGMQLLKNFAQL